MENLENILEALLFVAGEPVAISDISAKLDATNAQIKKAAAKLADKYSADCGINFLQFNDKLQFSSSPKYADSVACVLNPIRTRNLTKTTLETASIIAYKQPVTRMEIEEIRGSSCDYAINVLLDHHLIEVVGHKDTVGHPALFGTTDEFLKRFDISDISELPDYQQMLDDIEKINAKAADDSLYNNFKVEDTRTEEQVDAALAEAAKQATSEQSSGEVADNADQELVDANLADYDDYLGSADDDML